MDTFREHDSLPNVIATIKNTASAIRIPGDPDDEGSITFAMSAADLLQIAARFRGRVLRLSIEVGE